MPRGQGPQHQAQRLRFLVFIGLAGHKSKVQLWSLPDDLSAGLRQLSRVRTLQGQWVRAGTELSHFRLSELCSLGRREEEMLHLCVPKERVPFLGSDEPPGRLTGLTPSPDRWEGNAAGEASLYPDAKSLSCYS